MTIPEGRATNPDHLATLRVMELTQDRVTLQFGRYAMGALSSAMAYVGSRKGFQIIQANDYYPLFGVTQDETVNLHQALSDVFDKMWRVHPDFDHDQTARRYLGAMSAASKGYL